MEQVTEHDLRCPELSDPQLEPNPARCTCRDEQGHTVATSWADGPLCAFDLETTGVDPLEARIVTATVIRIRPGCAAAATSWLSDVAGEPIPDEAAAVHGVDTATARADGRPLADVVDEVRTAIETAWADGVPLVGFNVMTYDLSLLAAECARFRMRRFAITGPVIDSLVMDRGADRYRRGSRKLVDTARHYGIHLCDQDAHSAYADALAAARVAWKIAKQYPVIGAMPLPALQKWQADRYRSWAENFGSYLAKNGKVDDVQREWTIRWHRGATS